MAINYHRFLAMMEELVKAPECAVSFLLLFITLFFVPSYLQPPSCHSLPPLVWFIYCFSACCVRCCAFCFQSSRLQVSVRVSLATVTLHTCLNVHRSQRRPVAATLQTSTFNISQPPTSVKSISPHQSVRGEKTGELILTGVHRGLLKGCPILTAGYVPRSQAPSFLLVKQKPLQKALVF